MRHLSLLICLLFVICCVASQPTHADTDWPQFRGPDGTGAVPDAETVTSLDLKTGKNIKWAADMPGPTAGTPAIVGDYIFTTAGTTDTNRLVAMALSRKTGEVLWQHDVAEARKSRQRSRENNHAVCSPAADDKHAYFLFGGGDLLAVTHQGEEKWHINLTEMYGKIEILWGYSSSPLLLDGKLYVMVLRRQPSFLLCIDPATGEVLWKQDRPTTAEGESPESYASPIAATIDGKKQIICYGGDCLTGHDPTTGEELWRFTEDINPTNNKMFRVISGPTQGLNGLIYFTTPRGEDLFAVEVKDNQPRLKWMAEKVNADVPCPVYTETGLYVLSGGKKRIFKFDPGTGEKLWEGRIDTPGYFRCGPTYANKHLYLVDGDGELFIYYAGDDLKKVSHTSLGGYPTRATIAVAGDDLFIRTGNKLICAGK
ncbi:MAG: PQQ-binding-like beta-propeller repeat protein [Planctomycetota bacterium]